MTFKGLVKEGKGVDSIPKRRSAMDEPKTDKQQAYEDGFSDGRLHCQTSMEQMQKLTTKQIKEIEQLTDVNKAREALTKAQGKKIKRLLKEKGWLIENYVKTLYGQMGEYTKKEYKIILTDAMQQALKEE